MSHASDATHSPTENQAGDSVWKYSDQSVCICVVGPGEELWEAQVYPSKMSWNLGLKAALEKKKKKSSLGNHNWRLQFSRPETKTLGAGGGQWRSQSHPASSGPPQGPEWCPFLEHTAPLNLETRGFSFNIRPVGDLLGSTGKNNFIQLHRDWISEVFFAPYHSVTQL